MRQIVIAPQMTLVEMEAPADRKLLVEGPSKQEKPAKPIHSCVPVDSGRIP